MRSSILSFAVLLIILSIASSSSPKKIVCYLGSWAVYRPGDGKFDVENIDPNLCTHVIYSFVGITSDGGVRILDSWNEIDKGAFRRFNALREQNPALKTLAAIGGWNEGSSPYSNVMNSDSKRKAFVSNVVNFVAQYGFDGFDLDWEYPGQRGGVASDKEAFVKLLKELRAEFDKYGYLLTAAVAAAEPSAQISYNIPEVGKYLDFINIMTYDLHGSWEKVIGHNAPLYSGPADVTENDLLLNVDASINYWVSQGAPKEKVILGMGAYGRSFTLADPSKCYIGAPAAGAGSAGPYTREAGMLGFNEICEKQSSWNVKWDDDQKVPYACNGNQFVGYDNVESITIKAQYIVEKGLGGGMIWSLETDDFLGKCLGHKYPLLTAINNAFGNTIQTPDPEVTPPTEKPEVTPEPGKTEAPPVTDDVCKKEGYVRDPIACNVFYFCQAVNGKYAQYRYECPPGLKYNTDKDICDWSSAVQC